MPSNGNGFSKASKVISTVAVIIGLFSATAASIGTYFVLKYRVDLIEIKQERIAAKVECNHDDILILKERTKTKEKK